MSFIKHGVVMGGAFVIYKPNKSSRSRPIQPEAEDVIETAPSNIEVINVSSEPEEDIQAAEEQIYGGELSAEIAIETAEPEKVMEPTVKLTKKERKKNKKKLLELSNES